MHHTSGRLSPTMSACFNSDTPTPTWSTTAATMTLSACWLKARALARLDEIAELGTPTGEGLPALAEELRNTVIACGVERAPEDVIRAPICPGCGMHLGATPPTNDVKQTVALVDEALTTQNRRLATLVTHRLIERKDHDGVDTFVSVVQVSDLVGLANVLDDRLVDFIRNLLRNETRA